MMEIETEDVVEGTVVQEIQSGYIMHDRLLRPAMVSVSKKSFSDISAQRYAVALYEIVMEDSMLDKIENEINILSQLLKLSPEFRNIISNPSVSKNDQAKIIIKIAEKYNFSEIFKKFLGLLVF